MEEPIALSFFCLLTSRQGWPALREKMGETTKVSIMLLGSGLVKIIQILTTLLEQVELARALLPLDSAGTFLMMEYDS